MNHWQDDESRRRSHSRGAWRRLKTSVRTLMVVLGWVALALSLFLAGATWKRPQDLQHRLLVMSGWYAAGGVSLLLLNYLFFHLPHAIKDHQSESSQRRRQDRRRQSRSRAEPRSPGSIAPDPVPPGLAGKQGLALVFVLIMLGLIATLVVESQVAARYLLRQNESIAAVSSLRRAAGDAVRSALQRLADDEDLLVDYTNETCFVTEDISTPDGISLHVVVTDANRYFDVNNLAAKNVPPRRTPEDILADVLTLSGDFSPSAYVSALTDWVDADDEGLRESSDYLKGKPPYECANRIFYDWAELLAVAGGQRSLFDHHPRESTSDAFNADLVDALTVCPIVRERPRPINVNTATRESLRGVMGVGQDEMVQTILALRSFKPIRSLASVLAVDDPEFAENIRPYLDVRSHEFIVAARAYAHDRAVSIRALAQRDSSGQVQLVQWIF